jgi:phasin
MSDQEPPTPPPAKRRKKGTVQADAERRSKKKISKKVSLSESKMTMPGADRLSDATERTVEQAESAFGLFFDAANNLFPSIPHPATEVSKKALALTEQNMAAALDHAKKVAQANDLKEVMKLQTDFLRSQFANFGEQMRVIGEAMSAAMNPPKD